MSRSKIIAGLLGESKVFTMPAKMVFTATPSEEGNKIIFGGSGFVDDKKLAPEDHYEMIECEIIIIPKAIYRKSKWNKFWGMRIDQILRDHFDNPESWNEKEEF